MPDRTWGLCADHPRSYAQIECIATHIRDSITPHIGIDRAFPGISVFESLRRCQVILHGRRIPLTYDVKDLPDPTEAFTIYDENQSCIVVTLSETTYENLERGDTRARFSLPHEIAHAFEHTSILVRKLRIPHNQVAALYRTSSCPHPVCHDTEWQADAIAGALLMPAKGLALFHYRTRFDSSISI